MTIALALILVTDKKLPPELVVPEFVLLIALLYIPTFVVVVTVVVGLTVKYPP